VTYAKLPKNPGDDLTNVQFRIPDSYPTAQAQSYERFFGYELSIDDLNIGQITSFR